MVHARNLEFVRDRGAFFWNLFFPLLLIAGLTAIFGNNNNTIFTVGTIGEVPSGFYLLETSGIDHVDYSRQGESEHDALDALRKHQISMFINFETGKYYINDQSPDAALVKILITSSPLSLTESRISGESARYIDWMIPGIIALNLMFSCLLGVGFIIIRYRRNGVLKRMRATPISALSFICAQATSRFIIALFSSSVVFIGASLIFGASIKGSVFDLLFVTTLGIFGLISLGLLFATRIKTEELGGGLINLVTWPMMFLSGAFFSLESAPPAIQNVSRIFPLTHFLEAVRAITIDGAGLAQIFPNMLFLTVFTTVMFLISAMLFRWD